MDNTLLFLIVIAILLFLWFYYSKNKDGNDNLKILNVIAKGCSYRLYGIIKESLTTKVDIQNFVMQGDKKLVVLTDIEPEELVDKINNNKSVHNLKLLALSSSIVNNKKMFIVMNLSNGKSTPLGAPTTSFEDAFEYLERLVREELGSDNNNLVLYIDEDIPCPMNVQQSTNEMCCGRKF